MADETEYRIPIIADIGDLLAKFQEAGTAAQEMGDKMASGGDKAKEGGEKMAEGAEKGAEKLKELKEGVDKSTEAVGKMMSGWEGLLGVLGAGAVAEVMSKIAETTIELGTNLSITSAELGVNADAARGFMETMGQLGISTSSVSGAMRRLEMDAAAGGKSLHRLGIEIHDDNGNLKDGITLFEESVQHIRELATSAEQAQAAYLLWGRQGMQILSNLDAILPRLKDNTEEQKNNTAVNEMAEKEGVKLTTALTQLNSTWEDFTVRVSPAVVVALKGIIIVLKEAAIAAEMMAISLAQAFALASKIGTVASDLATAGANAPEEGGGLGFTDEKIQKYNDSLDKLRTDTQSYKDLWMKTGKEMADAFIKGNEELDKQIFGEEKAGEQIERNRHLLAAPGPKGKSPGTLDAEQMDNALQKATLDMEKLTGEQAKLGNEADMASKVSQESYATLAARASADFQMVKEKFEEMVAAIETGNKKASQEATQAWDNWKQKFQSDFDAARAKAEADMNAIKSKADQLAGEVSSILDNAITGKLNWAQEMEKVLQKMLNSVVKYLFEMVAKWGQAEASKNAVTATGEAEGQAIQKTSNASTIQSDAGTAAANAYKAVAGIPYIGPFLAPAAAAVAYAGVMAFSAEAGFDVPPGLKPLTQLHPREMVLPESLATNVRNMSTAGAGGGPGSNVTQNINLSAFDGQSVVDMLLGNGGAIAGAMAGALRSGMVLNTGG